MKSYTRNFKKYLLLLIVLIPVLIFAVFFSNYYPIYRDLTNLSEHNPDIDTIVRNPFEDIEAIEENEENIQEDKNPTVGKTDSLNKTGRNTETNPPDNAEKLPYNYIVGIYKSRFEKLQQEQESKLYSLIDEAIGEYIKNGSKKSSLLSMAPKYMGLANSMERQANKEVDTLIDNLKTDLARNSYDTDITEEIRDYYDYYKKVFRAEIIREGAKHL